MSSSGSTSAQGCDCCVICWHELSPQIPRNGFYVYALTSATRPVPLINDHDGRLSEDQKARLKVYLLMQEIPEYIAQKKYEDLKDSLDCTTKIVKRFRESGLLQQPHPAEGPSQELAALYDETIKLCPTCRTHLTMLESPGIIIVPEFCEDLDNAWQAEIERRSRGEEHLSLWKATEQYCRNHPHLDTFTLLSSYRAYTPNSSHLNIAGKPFTRLTLGDKEKGLIVSPAAIAWKAVQSFGFHDTNTFSYWPTACHDFMKKDQVEVTALLGCFNRE